MDVVSCLGQGGSGGALTTDNISILDSSLGADPKFFSHVTDLLDDSSSCTQVCVREVGDTLSQGFPLDP